MRCARRVACVFFLFSCAACAVFKVSDHFGAREVSFNDLPGWQTDNQAEALAAFLATCPILTRKAWPASPGSGLQVPEGVWHSLCDDAGRIPSHDRRLARQFFERRFIPYRVTNNGREQGLFTGYYEPVLYGSLRKKGHFIYPLYKAPPDLAKRKPYFTQAEIDGGALERKQLELLWVDDPVMRFFLEIQGSGRIRLAHGREILVGYAGGNGQPYVSLGKIMGEEGLLPKDRINFFSIRQWLYQHPDKAFTLMERNPSFIFFRRLDSSGAIGAAGAVLTPQRSLAVDSRYIPYGLPLFLETTLPPTQVTPASPFCRLFIAQDTGGAITGPVRGDIFFGSGEGAEYMAGYMRGHGVYTLLVPKEVAYQLQRGL